MDEKLPAERGEVRHDISDLLEADGWLPMDAAAAPEPGDQDEPQRPETD